MLDLLENLLRRGSKENGSASISLSVIATYAALYNSYDETTKAIVSLLGIQSAADLEFWQRQIKEIDGREISNLYHSSNIANSFLPKIVSLLDRTYSDLGSERKVAADLKNELEVQTIILTDEDGDNQSSPERLIVLLTSVSSLYASISEIRGIHTQPIAVVGMDSGSEKSFDFLGVSTIIKEVRECFIFAYNAIFFHKQTSTSRNIGVISESLPLLMHIKQMEDSDAITAEQAARLRHGIMGSLDKFIDAGAYLPEMRHVGVASPALLMKPQPKLLTAPAGSTPARFEDPLKGDVTDKDVQPELSAEQLQRIAAIVEESKSGARSTASSPVPEYPIEKNATHGEEDER